jgi:cytochrome c oxidase subunit IV
MKTLQQPILRILTVYCALMALLALTASASHLPPGWYSTPIALGAAVSKLALIFWFFMNLRRQQPLVRIVAAAGFFWLAVLVLLSGSDFATRGWPF